MEASCCGSDFGILNNCHYNVEHYKQMGHGFLDAIHNYYMSQITNVKSSSSLPPLSPICPRPKSDDNAYPLTRKISIVKLNLNDPIQRKEKFPNLFSKQKQKPIKKERKSELLPITKQYLPIKLIHPPFINREIPKRRQNHNDENSQFSNK